LRFPIDRVRKSGLALLVAVFLCAFPALASAATYQVNSLVDTENIFDPLTGCTTPGGLGGDCSLRDAVNLANGDDEESAIEFEVAGTITVDEVPLPHVTAPVAIDATTAPGYTDAPVVAIDGSAVEVEGPATEGISFLFAAGESSVEGLAIGGFDIGIRLSGSGPGHACANYVGVGLDGVTALPNGVGVESGPGVLGNQIGANCPEGIGNLISGNSSYGIVDFGIGTEIVNNKIGVNALGGSLPNGPPLGSAAGILVAGTAEDPYIGPLGEGGGPNEIGFNHGPGVLVENAGSHASIRHNSIFANSGSGIHIGEGGDTLPRPELEAAQELPENTAVSGSLDAGPEESFQVDFFANEECDSSGSGQGQYFLGEQTVTTDEDGAADFEAIELQSAPAGADVITATATDEATGSTSEFSLCVTAEQPSPPPGPEAPVLEGTTPASPGNDLTPLLFGTAETGLAVALYTEADCQGVPATFVTAEELEAGVEVTVAADAVTEFSAEAYEGESGSECSEPLTYVEDSTAPEAEIIDPKPTDPTESREATFNFQATDDSGIAGFECSLDGAGFAECGPGSESYEDLGLGSHSFEVLAIDEAGNVGPPAEYTWTVQEPPYVPPAAPVLTVTQPGSPGNDLTPLIFGTAETGRDVALYTEADCQGVPATFVTAEELEAGVEVTVAADSVTEFSATASDGEVTSDCSGPLTYREDSTSPAAQIDPPKPANPTSSQTAEFECSLDEASFATCTSPATYGPLAAGPHSFEVRAIDEAGNVGTPALFNWTIETTPPTVVIDSVSKTLLAEGESSELKFHANRDGAFSLRLDAPDCGVESGDNLASGSYSGSPAEQGIVVAAADLGEGVNALRLCLTDDLDLTGSATTTISKDSAAPETQIDPPKPPDPTASTSAELNFSGTDPGSGIAGFECRLDPAAFSPCTTPTFYTSLGNGLHHFEVRAIDEAGNVDPTPASYEWTIDTTLPTVIIDSVSKPLLAEGESAELRFHADRDGNFSLRLGAPDCGSESGELIESGSYSGAPAEQGIPVAAADLGEGPNSLLLCLSDDLDRTGSATTTISKDSAAPETQIDEPKPANPSPSGEATLKFSGSDGGSGISGFRCSLDGAAFSSCASPKTYASLANGPHGFEVRAVDAAGNVDPTPASYSWTVKIPAPVVKVVPVNGEVFVVAPKEGKVLIKLPGEKVFRELSELETIPVGAVVDATNGKVRLTSIDAHGNEQTAYFFGGVFRVTQRDGSGLTTLRLEGGNPNSCGGVTRGHAIPAHPGGIPCSCTSASSSLASASRGGRGRHLWGSGHGNFRTEGSYGSATVRGTIWFVEDICGATFFKVKRGIVSVRDFPHSRTISLPAGKTYLAQP
jgi:hypothetical protein